MSVDLADNALITFEEFRLYKGWKENDEDVDQDRIRTFINAASQKIQNYLNGRILITPAAQIDEIFDGNDMKDRYVRQRRIADGDTPVVYYWNGTGWTQCTESTVINRTRTRIYFSEGYVFGTGFDNWKITYKPGWTQVALPQDLKEVCTALVERQIMLADKKEGMDSQSFGDSTTSYNLAKSPKEYLKTLDHYRVIPIG